MSKIFKDKVEIEQTYAKFIIECTRDLTSNDDIQEAIDSIKEKHEDLERQMTLIENEEHFLFCMLRANQPDEEEEE